MVNYTLKQLRYVEAADRLGTIANAAAELNISQSSITAAIDTLEAGLRYDVFIRTPAKGIRATASGTEILALIRRFIHQARQFEDELASFGGEAKGTVRIACYATAAPAFLPPILRLITSQFPDISIQLLEGNMDRVIQYLVEGDADMGFTYDESIVTGQNFEPLFAAPPYVMVPLNDPMAKRDSVSMADLIDKPMVLLDLPRTRDYFLGMFEGTGGLPIVAHSSRSSEIVRALVAGGFGFSFLNIRPVDYRENVSKYKILPLRDPPRVPVFGITTMSGTQHPRVVKTIIQSCVSLSEAGAFDQLTVRLPYKDNHN